MTETVSTAGLRLQPLSLLGRIASDRAPISSAPDLTGPVDLSRHFICETLTPLFHAPVYQQLTEPQRRRYNQITGMCFIEMITFIEETFANNLLRALAEAGSPLVSPDLATCLRGFLREEKFHTEMFHRLKRLSSPRYAEGDYYLLRLRPALRSVLAWFTRRPMEFPFVIWMALILEEFSIEISKRVNRLPHDRLEPHYASVFRSHLADEVRHVQIDWHLLEIFHEGSGRLRRGANAGMLRFVLHHFFLWPKRLTVRLAKLLVGDCPELGPLLPRMVAELTELDRRQTLRGEHFTRESHPIAFSLFDRYPEFWSMRRILPSYRPPPEGSRHG